MKATRRLGANGFGEDGIALKAVGDFFQLAGLGLSMSLSVPVASLAALASLIAGIVLGTMDEKKSPRWWLPSFCLFAIPFLILLCSVPNHPTGSLQPGEQWRPRSIDFLLIAQIPISAMLVVLQTGRRWAVLLISLSQFWLTVCVALACKMSITRVWL